MTFINFIIVRFALLVALGILAAHFFPVSFSVVPLLISLCFLLIVLWYTSLSYWQASAWFGLIAYFSFFFVGYGSYQLRMPNFQPTHYSHTLESNGPILIQAKITGKLKPDHYNQKYIAKVFHYNDKATTGTIILYVTKESGLAEFEIDDVLLISAEITELPKALNPHQFDYSEYLRGLEVHHQVRISEKDLLQHHTGRTTLRGFAEGVRNHCIAALKQTPLQVEERAIVQALVLGQRNEIDQSLYSQYAAAGAVHILAVSGLHVGILFVMFQYLTRSLRRLKYGRHLQALLVIVALYAFALLAGLSPSVVRAATMFSLFVFAQSLRRETNSMNTLFISFLALLILNPLWLFHVGFQMSYLAVFFILWVQPIFYKLWKPKAWLPKKAWGIASVTLAAQLGVIPVSLYYFHQLPGLFLLTNLVVLPFIGVLLVAGLIILILALLQSLPDFLAITYNYLVTGLNAFIGWVASQDAFLFSEIPFNVWNVLAAYAIIVGVILFWQRRTLATLGFTLAGVLILLSGLVYNKLENSREALVIFHKSRTSLMAVRENGTLRLFHRDTVPKAWESTYPVAAYLLETGNPEVQQEPLPDVFQYKEKTIVVVDSAGIYPTSRTVDIVLLTQSPRVNLDRLIATLNPSLIIADGNNYRSYVTRWRETCQKKKLPFHHTGTKGAFIIEQ